jgi:hypothetical protein
MPQRRTWRWLLTRAPAIEIIEASFKFAERPAPGGSVRAKYLTDWAGMEPLRIDQIATIESLLVDPAI